MNSQRKPLRQRTDMDLQGTEAPVVRLGPEIKARIGQQLRLMYGEVVNQGVPERFVEILRSLDNPRTDEGPTE